MTRRLSPGGIGPTHRGRRIIVAALYVILALTVYPQAVTDVVAHGRSLLNGAFAWLILTGIIYLIARYGLRGEGSFQECWPPRHWPTRC